MDRTPSALTDPQTTEQRQAWRRPVLNRLIAGGAEGSADIATDGIDIPS